jgi:chorismate synthase
MGSSFGKHLTVTTFGESHGPGVGVVIDGLPAGVPVTVEMIQADLDRRRPGRSPYTSPRNEPDAAEILSGVGNGLSLGSPIAVLVRNRDARSGDYGEISRLFRPGHADYTYFKKYGLPPQPGGGRSSGRETVGRVAAGAAARGFLAGLGVSIFAVTVAVGAVKAGRVDPDFAHDHPLRAADPDSAPAMEEEILAAKNDGDSIGGVVEVQAHGVPAGLGDPVFDKLDARLAAAMLSIGGVKGVEFGDGFALTQKRGAQSNDSLTPTGFASNHAGGMLGGVSTGQPIIVRLAVKPTSSIAVPQATIDLDGKPATIAVHGRHDPCLCPRIAPVAEAMTALTLADLYLEQQARVGGCR